MNITKESVYVIGIIGVVFAILTVAAWVTVSVMSRLHHTYKEYTKSKEYSYKAKLEQLKKSQEINRFLYAVLLDLVTASDNETKLYRIMNLKYMLLMACAKTPKDGFEIFYDGLESGTAYDKSIEDIHESLKVMFTLDQNAWDGVSTDVRTAFDKFDEAYKAANTEYYHNMSESAAHKIKPSIVFDENVYNKGVLKAAELSHSDMTAASEKALDERERKELLDEFTKMVADLPDDDDDIAATEEAVESAEDVQERETVAV